MVKVTMPQLGESVAEGTIGKWLKQPGDHVAKYEPLLEVITDKVNAEVPSPYEGILTEILAQEGDTVPNNAEIAIIDEVGAATDAPTTSAAAASTPASPAEGPAGSDEGPMRTPEPAPAAAPPVATPPVAAPASPAAPVAPAAAAATATQAAASAAGTSNGHSAVALPADLPGNGDARMTPAVRRLLREHGLLAAQIVGTGGGSRITREDVLHFVEAARTGQPVGGQVPGGRGAASAAPAAIQADPASSAVTAPASARSASTPPASAAAAVAAIVFPPGADEIVVPMTQMRKGIAAQMTRALAVPHAYVHMEVDVSNLVRLRQANKGSYQAREGIGLSYVPFVVKACCEALRRHPTFNAQWTDEGLVAKRRINVGVAVAVADGLIVPVIRDVDQLSVSGVNRAIADVAARARTGKFRVDDFGGGTFTIDNTGWLGSNLTMPIINVPEVAIITMEAITKRAVVLETPEGDVIAIRPMMNMVMGIDHRANDGAGAADFLRDVKAWLEAVGPETAIS